MYPQEAMNAGVWGNVTVSVIINEVGIVTSAHAVDGHRLLRSAAEELARNTVFAPAVVGGEPVNVKGFVTYDFVLLQVPPNKSFDPTAR
jgi:TonB family protein